MSVYLVIFTLVFNQPSIRTDAIRFESVMLPCSVSVYCHCSCVFVYCVNFGGDLGLLR